MSSLFDYVARRAVDWWFRVKSPGGIMVGAGLTVFTSSTDIFPQAVFTLASDWVDFEIQFFEGYSDPPYLRSALSAVGIVFIALGVIWFYRNHINRLTFAIEIRGLTTGIDSPLRNFIPSRFLGSQQSIHVDIREFVQDGRIIEPERALDKIRQLPETIIQCTSDVHRRNVSTVYGGLVAVPFAVAAGTLIEDEGTILILDWDRDKEKWREIDGPDDGDRFYSTGLDQIGKNIEEVILAVSISYKIKDDAIRETLSGMPIVRLDLTNNSPTCHWSRDKQTELTKQFRETIVGLENLGVSRVHLFLAAQGSVAFRFGRSYDGRNMPEMLVYQYEKSDAPPYPWSVVLPSHGKEAPSILWTAK